MSQPFSYEPSSEEREEYGRCDEFEKLDDGADSDEDTESDDNWEEGIAYL